MNTIINDPAQQAKDFSNQLGTLAAENAGVSAPFTKHLLANLRLLRQRNRRREAVMETLRMKQLLR